MAHAATVTRFRAGEAQEAAMASPLVSPSGLWTVLGQASNVAQLVGVDALGLVSMVVQAALAARRHRDACRRLAQHVDIVGGLLRELELAELIRREATRSPPAAPGCPAAVLRPRHGVPGLRVPPQPVSRRPDGRRAPRRGAGDRHVHPPRPAYRARRHYT